MSDDVMGGSTKTVQQSNKHISRNIKAVAFKLGTRKHIVKETKRDPLCRCHDNGYAAGRLLIKTKILGFYLKHEGALYTGISSSTLNNLMGRVKTIWEPCVFRARPSVPFQRVANEHIWFFTERDWSQECCHGNKMVGVILFPFVMCISGAKFEEHCSNISGDINDSVFYFSSETIYDVITSLICIIQKRKYL